MAGPLGKLLVVLGMDAREFDQGITNAQKKSSEFDKNMTRAFVGAGAAAGAFIATGVQEFAKFDDQMRQVYSILPGISEKAMGEMEGQVKSLAVEMGRMPEDIIPGLYDALSSGIPQDNVFAFMESASKAAVAGGADTQEVVKVLSSTINAFGLDAANTEQIADSFFNAVNKGVTTFPELASSMSQVTPTAAAMGLEIEDVLAAITAMTLQGTPTAQAVTGINASLVALQRTTPQMEEALKSLGFETGQAALDALGYQGTMEALAEQADKMGVPLIELTGRMEGSAAMLQLTGENAATANELLGSFGDTAGLTTAAFETMEGGIGGAARRMGAQLKVALIDVGQQLEAFGPLFVAFGPQVGKWLGAGIGAAGGLVAKGLLTLANSGPVQAAAGKVGEIVARLAGDALDLGLRGLDLAKSTFLDLAQKLRFGLEDAWTMVASSRVGQAAGTAIGTAVGAAQALAHQTVATGAAAVQIMAAKIAAMSIPLAPAGTTVGMVLGGAFGTAFFAAAATGVAAGGLLFLQATFDSLSGALRGDSSQVNDAGEAFDVVMQGIAARSGQAAGTTAATTTLEALGEGLVYGPQLPADWVVRRIDPAGAGTEALRRYMSDLGVAGTDALGQGFLDNASHAADDLRETLRFAGQAAQADAANAFRELGERTTTALGNGMTSAEATQSLFSQIDQLTEAIKNHLSPKEQAIKFIGGKYVKDLIAGLKSGEPDLVLASQGLTVQSINTLEDGGLKGPKGRKSMKQMGQMYAALLASGMTAGEARAELAAAGVADATIDGLESNVGKADNAATAYVNAFNKALRSGKSSVLAAMQYTFGAAMRGQSPPKEGPLRDAILSAPNVAKTYVDMFNSGLTGLAFPGLSPQMPSLAFAGGSQTIRHEIDLTPQAAQALRDAGYDERGVAHQLGDIVSSAYANRGLRFNPSTG